jgi:hypothetical protein
MHATQAAARQAGATYFLFMIVAITGEFFLPDLVVSGDATATARNITSAELTWRLGILLGLLTHVIFIVLAVLLYKLLSGVDKSQAMLMVAFVSIGVAVAAVPMAFWGLWLFPFGVLVMKSGFLPRLLGILLLVAGLAYLATGVTAIVLPEYRTIVSRFMMPLYFGEVPVIFWLLVKGAAVPQEARVSLPPDSG